jgi:hypothetical protein
MLGDIRLRRAHGGHNVVHGARFFAYGLQNLQPHRFAQKPEMQSDLLQLPVGQIPLLFHV